MNLKLKQIYFTIWIYLPIVIIMGLISFIYTMYMMTLVIPLIYEEYDYSESIKQINDNAPLLLISMKHIVLTSHQILHNLPYTDITTETEKGWIYFGILNMLFFLFCIAYMKTLVTDPGRVPQKWNAEQIAKVQQLKIQACEQAKLKARITLEREMKLHENLRKLGNQESDDSEHLNRSHDSNNSNSILQMKRKSPRLSSSQDQQQSVESHQTNTHEISNNESQNLNGPRNIDQCSLIVSKIENTPDLYPYSGSDKEDSRRFKNWEEEIFEELLVEGRFRKCSHCSHYKPERTHHCRQCNACTLKMDHHCPWVNNCIGYYNYKYFMIMLIYSVLSLWFIWITYTEVVGHTILNKEINTETFFVIILMYIMSLTLAMILTIFTLFHFYLMYKGKTTLEHCEKTSKIRFGTSSWSNLKEVFGTNPFFWLLPIASENETKGLDYTVIREHNTSKNQCI